MLVILCRWDDEREGVKRKESSRSGSSAVLLSVSAKVLLLLFSSSQLCLCCCLVEYLCCSLRLLWLNRSSLKFKNCIILDLVQIVFEHFGFSKGSHAAF